MNGRMSAARFLAFAVAVGASSCTTWRPVASFEGWSLFAERGQSADASVYAAAVEPAKAAV